MTTHSRKAVNKLSNLHTGWLILLATPKFPYVPESRKNRVLNWSPSEMAKVLDFPPPKNGRVPNSGGGSKFWTLPFFGGGKGGQFRTQFFFWILAHREIWGWQEGSATLYFRKLICLKTATQLNNLQ